MAFVKAATSSSMKDGEARTVAVNGKEIALYRVNGNFYATDNACPHKGGPLGEGFLDGTVVTCPWHGWKFNIETGVSPVVSTAKVATMKTKVEGDDVLVEV